MTTAAESAESVFRYSASLPRAAATPAFLRILESPKKFALRSQTNFLPPNSGGVAAAWSVCKTASSASSAFCEAPSMTSLKSSSEVIKYAALLSIAFKFFPAAGFVNINFNIEIF